jgi:hypothetical protein
MTDLFRGLDADTDLSPFISRMKAGGLVFVRRYLKNLTPAEFYKLDAAGLRVGFIYETGATRALLGGVAGVADGQHAATQATALLAACGITPTPADDYALYPTIDSDVTDSDEIAACVAYCAGFGASIGPTFVLGGPYACGTILRATAAEMRLVDPWLAGAGGWNGSHAYLDALPPDYSRQGPTLAAGGEWAGVEWPDIGTPYDPDLATSLAWAA